MMGSSPRILFLLGLAAAAGAVAFGQGRRMSTPAPVKNYSVSVFSDEGYHQMHIRGATANLSDPEHVAVAGLTLSLFSGEQDQAVESVILSPQAIVEPEAQVVHGTESVRLLRDDLELTGEDWRYEHAAKRILIRRNARIVFNARLDDLLQ